MNGTLFALNNITFFVWSNFPEISMGYKFIKLYQLVIYNDLIINQLKTKHLSCTDFFQLMAHK
jgi:hypothetical protein